MSIIDLNSYTFSGLALSPPEEDTTPLIELIKRLTGKKREEQKSAKKVKNRVEAKARRTQQSAAGMKTRAQRRANANATARTVAAIQGTNDLSLQKTATAKSKKLKTKTLSIPAPKKVCLGILKKSGLSKRRVNWPPTPRIREN